jgi:hypothetical protein
MIGRALIGAVVAAVAMFILGFIFFATPLAGIGTKSLPDREAAAVQTALAQNLPGTATYSVPSDATAGQTTLYGRGPIATIHYNSSGFAIGNPATMISGFIHMLVVTSLMAVGLYIVSRYVASFAERVKLLILGTLGATIFMRLGEPIWFHHDWGNAIYLFVADTVSLGAAGLIILKLLPRTHLATSAPAEAPTSL